MTDELIFILKVVGSGVGFWLGFSTYKWLKENVLDPIKEFKPELKKTMAEIQEMKKDFEILTQFLSGNLVESIIE